MIMRWLPKRIYRSTFFSCVSTCVRLLVTSWHGARVCVCVLPVIFPLWLLDRDGPALAQGAALHGRVPSPARAQRPTGTGSIRTPCLPLLGGLGLHC
jgi:hypothetical protein